MTRWREQLEALAQEAAAGRTTYRHETFDLSVLPSERSLPNHAELNGGVETEAVETVNSEAVVPADFERLQAGFDPLVCVKLTTLGQNRASRSKILSLMATVDKPEAILAITFTNKAAAEMREQILTALDSARSPRPDEHTSNKLEARYERTQRDHQFGWNIAGRRSSSGCKPS